jgi:hypothetical protein
MIIYKRDRTGSKRKVGSSISPWDNVVATLPDMSSMMSKTYVNEIDVSKVKTGQHVEIVVDAFPEKSYTGTVMSVANIGEQLPNADAKVFEVLVEVDGSDPILRPSMTTGNKIITKTISNVIYIPLESVQAGADSIPFVFLKNGTRQVVVLGESNENNVVVEKGLDAGVPLYLSTPAEPGDFKLVGQELISVIKEKEAARKAEELRLKEEALKAREAENQMGPGGGGMRPGMNMTPEMMARFQNMRGGQQGAAQGGGQGTRNSQQAGPQGAVQNGGGNQQAFPQGGGQPRDTAAMRQFMRNNQGAPNGQPRDTAAMRRFMRMRNQQGGTRDTSARGGNRQFNRENPAQAGQTPASVEVQK